MSVLEQLAAPARVDELIQRNGKVEGSLLGINGNAFSVVGHVASLLKKGGWPRADIDEYQKFMFAGSYDELLYIGAQALEHPLGEEQ